MNARITAAAQLVATLMTLRSMISFGIKNVEKKELVEIFETYYKEGFEKFGVIEPLEILAEDIYPMTQSLEEKFIKDSFELIRTNFDEFKYEELRYVHAIIHYGFHELGCVKYMAESKAGIEHDPMGGLPLPLGTIPPPSKAEREAQKAEEDRYKVEQAAKIKLAVTTPPSPVQNTPNQS